MDQLRKAGDCCGARIDVAARGMPVGLGEPLYDKLDADIAYAMMGINAVKGVEIGAGFASVAQRGTTHGDELTPEGFVSNNAGGVLGGICTGQDLTVSIAIKPTSSIRSPRAPDRPRRQADRGRDQRPARPLRRHPRHADRRGDARAGGDGPRAAPSGAVRRRARRHRADPGPRALIPAIAGDLALAMNTLRLQLRFLIPLLLTLGVAAYLALPLMDRLTLRWFSRDLTMRSELVTNALSDSIADAIADPEGSRLEALFNRATKDERLIAIGLCSGNLLVRPHRELSARSRLRGGARGLVAALSADADRGRTGSRGHAQRRRHRVRSPTSCSCRTSASSPSAARTRADTSSSCSPRSAA